LRISAPFRYFIADTYMGCSEASQANRAYRLPGWNRELTDPTTTAAQAINILHPIAGVGWHAGVDGRNAAHAPLVKS
jgi:hypothetical protein